MRGARRPVRALCTALALAAASASVPAGAGDGPARPPVLLRRIPVVKGALWYSVTLLIPSGKAYDAEMTVDLARPQISGACVKLTRYADGDWTGGAAVYTDAHPTQTRQGDYAVATFSPNEFVTHPAVPGGILPSSPVGPLTLIDVGEDRPKGAVSPARRFGFRMQARAGDEPNERRQDLLFFCASSSRILASRLILRGDRGVRVLAESWGVGGTSIFREWDFAGGLHARAGSAAWDQFSVRAGEAMAAAGGHKTLRFRRHAAAAFWTANPHACVGGVCSPLAIPPASLLSVEGPGLRGGLVLAENVHANPWMYSLPGTPKGTYTFRIEAFAGAYSSTAAGAVASAAGQEAGAGASLLAGDHPSVMLATADADYPACTALPVRKDAPDGHPVCG